VFADGRELTGDVVMPFYGLAPSLDFMVGSGVDIERGLLVNPEHRLIFIQWMAKTSSFLQKDV
jgi:hypothetical protein